MQARQASDFIGDDWTTGGDRTLLQHVIEHVGPWTGDEPDARDRPAILQRVVKVPLIDGGDGTRRKRELLRDTDIVGIAIGHKRPAGQAALVIELEMELDRPLRSLEPGPIEHRGAQRVGPTRMALT